MDDSSLFLHSMPKTPNSGQCVRNHGMLPNIHCCFSYENTSAFSLIINTFSCKILGILNPIKPELSRYRELQNDNRHLSARHGQAVHNND